MHTKRGHQLRRHMGTKVHPWPTHQVIHPWTVSTHRGHGTPFPNALKGSTQANRSTTATQVASPSSLPTHSSTLCSGPSSHQASETAPAAKSSRHNSILMAAQDQTLVTIPSLKCTLEGFLQPWWPSLLGLLRRLPFRVQPSALFSHSTTPPHLGGLITSQLQ